jgi:hypothetical protein
MPEWDEGHAGPSGGPVKERRGRAPFALPKGEIVVTVGVHGDDGAQDHEGGSGFARDDTAQSSGLTVAEVGGFHEFGVSPFQLRSGAVHPGIPQRSFIRAWFDESQAFIAETLQSQMALVVAGKLTAEKAGERIALAFEGSVKQRIARGIPPPNAPATIEAKRSSKPLIDRGQLRAAVRGRSLVKVTP